MNSPNFSFKGKKVLISVGSTREYFDPVRFLSNASSGKMGLELSEECARLGARVTLLLGPGIPPPNKYNAISIVSARDLLKAAQREFPRNDIFISASAVCDWRPKNLYREKLTENKAELVLNLVPNPDVLATVAKKKKNRICVGFALENKMGDIRAARMKMVQKNCDIMVLNELGSMGSDSISATILFRDGEIWELGKVKKRRCAQKICEAICSLH